MNVVQVLQITCHPRTFATHSGRVRLHRMGSCLPTHPTLTHISTAFLGKRFFKCHSTPCAPSAQRVGQKSKSSEDADSPSQEGGTAKLIATLSVVGGLTILVIGGILMKDQIRAFLELFIDLVDDWGPLGYLAYIGVYSILELLAVPAIPLTMTAGIIFGVAPGTAVVSIASTAAAAISFLIARYVARDRVYVWTSKNPKFAAIDRAIGKDGFRVVALLRLSPLLPLAASNYLYGLTSVDFVSYVFASWLGMLPGTIAYVAAGTYGKEFLLGAGEGAAGSGQGGFQPWQVAVALGCTALAVGYVGMLAKNALKDVDSEIAEGGGGEH